MNSIIQYGLRNIKTKKMVHCSISRDILCHTGVNHHLTDLRGDGDDDWLVDSKNIVLSALKSKLSGNFYNMPSHSLEVKNYEIVKVITKVTIEKV